MPGMAPQDLRGIKGRLGEGRCPVPLTGALVRCPEVESTRAQGGRIDDLGLGLVVDGAYPAAAEVVDLGSGYPRTLDLEGPAVLLGWVAAETVEPLGSLLRRDGAEASGFSVAVGLLRRRGVDVLTVPIALRMGFADICRDLDPHEHPAVRFRLARGGVARARFEAEGAALQLLTSRTDRARELRDGLEEAFPGREARDEPADAVAGLPGVRVSFPFPRGLDGARDLLREVREGLITLMARFNPERHRAVTEMVETFGPRDSLRLLASQEHADEAPASLETEGREGRSAAHPAAATNRWVH